MVIMITIIITNENINDDGDDYNNYKINNKRCDNDSACAYENDHEKLERNVLLFLE